MDSLAFHQPSTCATTTPGGVQSQAPIPNIVHMAWLSGAKLMFAKLLSILSIHYVWRPDALYLYYNELPNDAPEWRCACKLARCVPVDLKTHVFGAALDSRPDPTDRFASDRLGRCANAQLDLLRIETLMRQGGAFLDLDVFALDAAKLAAWRSCGDPPARAVVGADPYTHRLNGGVILAAAQSRFLKAWKAAFKAYDARAWDYGACNQSTLVAGAVGAPEVVPAVELGPLPRYASRALYDAHLASAPLAHLSAFRHPWRLHDVMNARHLEHAWRVVQRAINESAADDISRTDGEVQQCLEQIGGACWARPGRKCGIYGA